MKKFILLLVLFCINFCLATEFFSVSLNENEKLEGSISNNFYNNESSHFLIIRNTQSSKYIVRSFLINNEKKVIQLEDAIFNEMPNILSQHKKENTLTFTNYSKRNKTLFIVDLDTNTGKKSFDKIENIETPDLVFTESNFSTIINLDSSGKSITIQKIESSILNTNKTFYVPEELIKEFKTIVKNTPDAINQNEFVKNGSINPFKAYYINENIYFTDNSNRELSNVFQLNYNSPSPLSKYYFKTNFDKELKDINSYIVDNSFVVLGSGKEDFSVNAFNLDNQQLINKVSFLNDLKENFNSSELDNFLKEAKKSSLKSTITINKTLNNNLKVRIDRVNKNTYQYNYNWWFHTWFMQHQQMMMQQMMMHNQIRAGGFGPSNQFDAYFDFILSLKEDKYQSLEFVVNPTDFKIITSSNEETIFKNIDKEALLSPYEENNNFKEFSCAFTDLEYRFIYYNKKSKKVHIEVKNIN